VAFHGWMLSGQAMMPCFDVFAAPSRHDGAPIVVAEAMAAGVPVVAGRVGGLPDRVTHGRDGLLIEPDDVVALSDALQRLLEDQALARRLGDAGRQRVRADGFEAMIEKLHGIYDVAVAHDGLAGASRRLGTPPVDVHAARIDANLNGVVAAG